MTYTFSMVSPSTTVWNEIEKTYDSTVYKTKSWYDYLYSWKKVTPFLVEVSGDSNKLGYFVGEKIKKGLTIIGSPFEGIGTAHQGLSLLSEVSKQERIEIYKELASWIFKNRHGSFLQIEDWQIELDDMKDSGVYYEPHAGYMIDLSLEEDVLFQNLHQKSCRYSINKSIKSGVTIRETQDKDKFVEIYYEQLLEVFDKQGLVPTYDKACVQSLVDSMLPTGNILLLEAVDSEGNIIATGLFPGDNNLSIFWGGASYSRYQKLCPNEPLIWEAIKMWKARGCKVFDMCGVRQYKLKFGPINYEKPRIVFAKFGMLITAKNTCKKLYYGIREFKAKFKK